MTEPRIRDTLAGAHLVVTGATGFVGKVWLCHLLCEVPEIGRVTLLVRGRKGLSATERVARFVDTSPAFRPLRARLGRDLAAWWDARVEVVDAELSAPGLGLDPATRDRIAASADALVHIAGLTQFHPDPRKGFPVNVLGTRHAAELALRFRRPRFLHMSTAFVAGVADGETPERLEPGVSPLGERFDVDATIRAAAEVVERVEDPTERLDQVAAQAAALGWPNLYTFTKGLAEHLLAEQPLELAIVRPAVVESSRTFPFPGWNEDLNTSSPIGWYCGTPFPALPAAPDHVFDIVPVDAVARWTTVVLARLLRGQAERVHQFASGDVNPATFRRIAELTALAKRRHAARPGARPRERFEAMIDVTARRWEDQPLLTPHRVAGWIGAAAAALDRVGPRSPRALTEARAALLRQERTLRRLRRMLDQYRPFIHDHSWRFHTDRTRAAVAALHPDDREAFGDDVSDLCWRHYWLEIQYPAMVKWAFPLLDGQTVPADPPSDPPLVLGRHAPAWDAADEVA